MFEWNEAYSVGIGEIDAQHRQLFEAAEQLHQAMRARQANDVLRDVFGRLVKYTMAHFAAEERLMSKHGFPSYAQHRVEHEKLTARVCDMKQRFDRGEIALSGELLKFLRDWLDHHINGTDKGYTAFLHAKGVR